MLSRPPASLAAAISARPVCSSERPRSSSIGLSSGSWTIAGETVGAEQEHVAGACGEDVDVDLDVGIGAERARDDAALRMRLGLLLGQLAAGDELADERVVAREPDQVAVAQQVGARVADVRDDHVVAVEVGGGDRRPHPGEVGVVAGLAVDLGVRLADQLGQRLAGRAAVGQPALELLDRQLGGHLARLRAAHPVRDHEQRRADEVVVLVALALAAEVGVVEVLGDPQHGFVSARR